MSKVDYGPGVTPPDEIPDEAPPAMNRTGILETASNLISGDRAEAYGDYGDQMRSLSAAFNAITGHNISPEDASRFLMLLKIRRGITATDQDSETDLAGYAALHGEHFKT